MRRAAGVVLSSFFQTFQLSYVLLIEDVLKFMDPAAKNVTEEDFKVLYSIVEFLLFIRCTLQQLIV